MCDHPVTIGYNHGVSCQVTGQEKCIHFWIPMRGCFRKYEICLYCQETRKKPQTSPSLKNGAERKLDMNDEMKANVISRTEALELVAASYLDDECMYCHRKFTRAELNSAIWAHPNKFGRIVHKECWDANN